jgi:hypothetical protein
MELESIYEIRQSQVIPQVVPTIDRRNNQDNYCLIGAINGTITCQS